MKTVLALCCAAILPAAELAVRDLRAAAATRPTGFSFTTTTPTSESSGDDAFASAIGLELGGRWSWSRPGDSLGALFGADLALDAASYADGGSMAESAARIAAGTGWAVSDRWTATAELGWRYGVATLTLPASSSAPDFTASGTGTGWDLRLGADAALTRTLVGGAFAGWASTTYQLSGDEVDITMTRSGWFLGLELRWRFTDAPPRLE